MGCKSLTYSNFATSLKVVHRDFGIIQKTCAGAYRYGYHGMEQDFEEKDHGNTYTTEFRQYDPRIGRWMSLDAMMTDFPSWSPYVAFNDNPVMYTDPQGLFPSINWGCIKEVLSNVADKLKDFGADVGKFAGTNSNFLIQNAFWGSVKGNSGGTGQMGQGNGVIQGIGNPNNPKNSFTNNRSFKPGTSYKNIQSGSIYTYDDKYTENPWVLELPKVNATPKKIAQSGGGCPNCLDQSSVGHNLLGLSYPGGNNPLTRSGDYSYSYVPTNLSEYPAIGHDRRYDKLGIKGASGLFTDTRAIGADWRFVGEELSIAGNPFLNPIDRMSAGILGVGLGLSALPKTLFQLSTPFGYMQTMMWYNISNQGVNNAPTIHKH